MNNEDDLTVKIPVTPPTNGSSDDTGMVYLGDLILEICNRLGVPMHRVARIVLDPGEAYIMLGHKLTDPETSTYGEHVYTERRRSISTRIRDNSEEEE